MSVCLCGAVKGHGGGVEGGRWGRKEIWNIVQTNLFIHMRTKNIHRYSGDVPGDVLAVCVCAVG